MTQNAPGSCSAASSCASSTARSADESSANTSAAPAADGPSVSRTPSGSGPTSASRDGSEDHTVVPGLISSFSATVLVLINDDASLGRRNPGRQGPARIA